MDTLGAYWRLCHIGNNYSAREVIRFLVLLIMIQGGTITGILSELGGGIVGALVFSAIYEKSNSIGWPILIHTCLDFVGYLI